MNFTKIKALANEYSDLFIKDEEEFMKRYQIDIPKYSIPEQMAVFSLADIYHAYKTGVADRNEVIKMQRELREVYARELVKAV